MTFCERSPEEIRDALDRARRSLGRPDRALRLEPPLVIAGDVHGDGLALEHVMAFAEENDAFPVLLGDFIDRAPDGNCVDEAVRVMDLIGEGRLLSLRGNHENFLHRSLGPYLHLRTDLLMCYEEAPELVREFGEAFLHLPLVATTGSVLLTHAGMPPLPLDRIDGADPDVSVPLTWADPEEFNVHGLHSFDRGDVEGCLSNLGLAAVVRGHTAPLNRVVVYGTVLTLQTSRVFADQGAGGVNLVLLADEIGTVDQMEMYSLDPPHWRRATPVYV